MAGAWFPQPIDLSDQLLTVFSLYFRASRFDAGASLRHSKIERNFGVLESAFSGVDRHRYPRYAGPYRGNTSPRDRKHPDLEGGPDMILWRGDLRNLAATQMITSAPPAWGYYALRVARSGLT